MRCMVTRAVRKTAAGASLAAAALFMSAVGAAADRVGQSRPGELNLQEPATQVARQLHDLHMLMLYIVTGICVLVMALLLIVIVRYNRAANPTPARFTHNALIEVIWTAVPVVILIVIAIPSIRLLYLQQDFSKFEPDVVIKATGSQWYWSYQYANEEIEFDSLMLGKGYANMNDEVRGELAEYGYPESAWKLATDTAVIVPVNKKVLVRVTASDVIHSWAIPAFGVKADGVAGRHNLTWFQAEEEGVYYGQCSELCGRDHAYMPITVKVVDQATYDAWVTCSQEGDVYECDPRKATEILTSEVEPASKPVVASLAETR